MGVVVSDRKEIVPPAPPGTVGLVRISPDGARIAFTRVDDPSAGIWVASALVPSASPTRLVAFQGWRADELAWSPDGGHLAYSVGGGPPPCAPRAIGWCRTAIPGEVGRIDGAAFGWTPRGNAVIVADVERGIVYRQMLTTGKANSLAVIDDDGDPQFPPHIAVSPDGNRIAFTARRVEEGVSEVWIIQKETKGVSTKLLTEIPGSDVHVHPFWSPKGLTIALHIVHLEQSRTAIIAVPRLEGEGVMLYENDLLDATEAPAWSPSGLTIAFFGAEQPRHEFTRSGPHRLVLLDTKSQSKTAVTEPDEMTGRPRFLDDQSLAVDGGVLAHVLTFANQTHSRGLASER